MSGDQDGGEPPPKKFKEEKPIISDGRGSDSNNLSAAEHEVLQIITEETRQPNQPGNIQPLLPSDDASGGRQISSEVVLDLMTSLQEEESEFVISLLPNDDDCEMINLFSREKDIISPTDIDDQLADYADQLTNHHADYIHPDDGSRDPSEEI